MQGNQVAILLGMLTVAGGGMYVYHLQQTGEKLEFTSAMDVKRVTLEQIFVDVTVQLTNRGTVPLQLNDMNIDVQTNNLRGRLDSLLTNVGNRPTVMARPNEPVSFTWSLATLPYSTLVQVFGQQNLNRIKSVGLDVEKVITTRLFGIYPIEKRERTVLKADLQTLMSFL